MSSCRRIFQKNMRDPTRIRDFGTAGSLLLDSMSILGSVLGHCGQFDQAFAILERAQAIPQKNAFDVTVVSFHHARAHLFRGDSDLAAPISRAAIEHATRVGLEFSLPWHLGMLGYAHSLDGDLETAIPLLETALEKSQQIHVPYLTASISVLLAETLAPRQPERALDLAEAALGLRELADFAPKKRSCFGSKGPRFSASIARRPRPRRKKAMSLRNG